MNVGDARPFHGRVIHETSETTNSLGIENSAAVVLPQGTVCLSRTGSIGYAVILGRPMATSQGFVNWICGPELLPEFLQLIFVAEQPFLHEISEGVAHTTIYFPEAKAFHVCIPRVEYQRHIIGEVDIQFSRLDEAVANLKRVRANLKRHKAAVLKAAVDGRLVPTEAELADRERRSYETGSQLLARVLQERRGAWSGKGSYREPVAPLEGYLPGLPAGWTVASLEAITSATRVICYGILMPKENVTDGVLYVKVKDMKDDVIDLASLHRTSRAIAAKYARAALRADDLLLSIRGTYGRVAQVPPALDGGNITQDTARLDVSKHVDASFVATFLRSDGAQTYFKTVARGVAVKGVNIGDLRPMAVPLPPLAEQQRIVAEVARRLSIVQEVESEVAANLRRAQGLRQAALELAFAGGRR